MSKNQNRSLIIPLGNFPEKYKSTYHNISQDFVIEFVSDNQFIFTKNKFGNVFTKFLTNIFVPESYMNETGSVVSQYIQYYKLQFSNIILVIDDLDIEIGKVKYQKGKYPKVHNGVNSFLPYFDLNSIYFLRIGIRRAEEFRKGEDYVLSKYDTNDDLIKLAKNNTSAILHKISLIS